MGLTRQLERTRGDLMRFGLIPPKALYTRGCKDLPRVLCITIPKSGTHLLERALCLSPGLHRRLYPTVGDGNVARWGDLDQILAKTRPGQVIMTHVSYTSQRQQWAAESGAKCLFMMRDPRDIAISRIHYMVKRRHHFARGAFASVDDFARRLKISIRGSSEHNLLSMRELLEMFTGWLSQDEFLTVRFEDLVGPSGGGDAVGQQKALTEILGFLELDATNGVIDHVADNLFSKASPTFRKGALGQWRDAFDAEAKELFKNTVGDLLYVYGYENSDDW